MLQIIVPERKFYGKFDILSICKRGEFYVLRENLNQPNCERPNFEKKLGRIAMHILKEAKISALTSRGSIFHSIKMWKQNKLFLLKIPKIAN